MKRIAILLLIAANAAASEPWAWHFGRSSTLTNLYSKQASLLEPCATNSHLWLPFDWEPTAGFYPDYSWRTNDLGQTTAAKRPAWTNVIAGALDFDGIDDYIDKTNFDTIQFSSFTVMFWMDLDTVATTLRLAGYTTGARTYGWELYSNNSTRTNSLQANLLDSGGSTIYVDRSCTGHSADTWYHFAWVVDASGTIKLYEDGVICGTETYVAPQYTTGMAINIGTQLNQTTLEFDGTLKEFTYFNYAATSNQVYDIYTRQKAAYEIP
jgi:hypothetical protein